MSVTIIDQQIIIISQGKTTVTQDFCGGGEDQTWHHWAYSPDNFTKCVILPIVSEVSLTLKLNTFSVGGEDRT
jgi:hypothetical protein